VYQSSHVYTESAEYAKPIVNTFIRRRSSRHTEIQTTYYTVDEKHDCTSNV